MIKYKPKSENHHSGTAASYLENFDAIASENICKQLQQKTKHKKCNAHPEIESVILVSAHPEIKFEVEFAV